MAGGEVEVEAKRLVDALLQTLPKDWSYNFKAGESDESKALFAASPEVRKAAIVPLLDQQVRSQYYSKAILEALLRPRIHFSAAEVEALMGNLSQSKARLFDFPLPAIVRIIEPIQEAGWLSD